MYYDLYNTKKSKRKGHLDQFCHKLFHPSKGLIMKSKISTNRMFVLLASVNSIEHACFKTITEDESHLWHCRLGHLSYKGLRTLHTKKMVKGLPLLKGPTRVF